MKTCNDKRSSRQWAKRPVALLVSLALGGGLFSGTVAAQSSRQEDENVTLDAVVIRGDGQRKVVGDAVQETAPDSQVTLGKETLEKFVGLDSPVTGALSYTPGVFFAGSDSSGVTEGSFSIRGFSQDQVGVTRDGVPVNDPQYGSPHADFFGEPENYDSISVLYGSASNASPALTASGGSIALTTVAPTARAGAFLKQSFGGNHLRKTFVRANTGEHNGFSAWVSASRTTAELWTKGGGDIESNRYESNLQYRWGNGNRVNAVLSSFIMKTNSYHTPTLAEYRSQSYSAGYPEQGYPTVGPDPDAPVTPSLEGQRADFKIQTVGVNGLFNLSDAVQLRVNPYYVHVTEGTASIMAFGLNETQINRDLNQDGDRADTRPVIGALFPTQYRVGGTVTTDWFLNAQHTLQFGLWHDLIHARHQIQFQPADGKGKPYEIDGSNPIRDGNGEVVHLANKGNRVTSRKIWVQDTWNGIDDVTITAGLAALHTRLESERKAELFTPGLAYKRSATYNRLLPSVKLAWQRNATEQVFYSVTSNVKLPLVESLYSAPGSGEQKPEKAINQELGWRYGTDNLLLGATLFFNSFKDRQASTDVGGVTSYINAGDVKTRGLELSLNGKFATSFRYFGNLSYTSAKQGSDYRVDNGPVYDTRGKQLFNTPKYLASVGIGYDDGALYGNFLARYVGSFYGDLANREKIGDYTVFDLNFGYRKKLSGHEVVFRLNLNNVFDKHYLSGVKGGVVLADASSPTYYRGQPRSVLGTLSVDF
ncbi:MAG: TonB-dependent receptor [Zoogloeaceae bacterium]|jgi:iron complex outermembrane receptor protein|nr:TonB-dependent receptor [Zoogloeaceae bacterium]